MEHLNTYTNTKDTGMNGRNFEVDLRAYLYSVIGRMAVDSDNRFHHMDLADLILKRGVTLEAKTGCGWLVSPFTADIREADALLANGFKMKKATYVAYLPQYNENTDISEVRFFTQAQFLRIFSDNGKVRVKRSSDKRYGLAIQTYIPTPTFRASKKVYANILAELDGGMTAEEFFERIGVA